MQLETVRKESKNVDFKEKLDINSSAEWCEIIKDIVAMANSGGGNILIGVRDDGVATGNDVTPILNFDPAKITDKLAKYTGEQFSDFEVQEICRDGYKVAVLRINAASTLMVFNVEGTYQTVNLGGKSQTKTAFTKGTIYFRHGAKSEPGNNNDIRNAIDRQLDQIRKNWFSNIRKVVQAPPGYRVSMLPPGTKVVSPVKKQVLPSEVTMTNQIGATPIRITDDLNAPAYLRINPDLTHPHTLKELVGYVNKRIDSSRKVSSYDVQCVRKVYDIANKPEFYCKLRRTSPQYSEQFIDWLTERYSKSPAFFDEAREKCKSK